MNRYHTSSLNVLLHNKIPSYVTADLDMLRSLRKNRTVCDLDGFLTIIKQSHGKIIQNQAHQEVVVSGQTQELYMPWLDTLTVFYVLDIDAAFCFLLLHEMRLSPTNTQNPVVKLLSATEQT